MDTALPLDPRVDDEFLSIACDDADWLRAEFDAIVAASWPELEDPGSSGDRVGGDGRFGRPGFSAAGRWWRYERTVVVARDEAARDRAPPGWV